MPASALPRFSIITAALNSRVYIARAVESTAQQSISAAEHLIIDGGSTDGTLETLAGYPQLKVTSEPDQGIYDAWNKGVRRAGGEMIGFLNSDDLYYPNALQTAAEIFIRDPGIEAVCGGADIFEEGSEGRVVIKHFPAVQPGDLLRRVTESAPIINAWFFRKSALERIGPFNPGLKIAGDSEFLIRAVLAGLCYRAVDQVFIGYRKHPGSLTIFPTPERWVKVEHEVLTVAETYLSEPAVLPAVRGWHSRASLFLAGHELRKFKLTGAARCLVRGWRANPRFPAVLAARLFRGGSGREGNS